MPTQQYPLLFQYARKQSDLLEAIELVHSGVQNSSIRNVDYLRAKDALGRAFEEAWRRHVLDSHIYHGLRQDHGEDPIRHEIVWTSVMSLHDAIAAHKRISKLDPAHPAAAAAAQVLNEAQPLALTLKALKEHVTKGRSARELPARPENPNKTIGSCPCCFRGIAVLQTTGKMAHHGFKRPMPGFQSASCPGIRFRPLEESTEGLEWLIRLSEKRLADAQDEYESAPSVERITQAAQRPQAKPETITPCDLRWPSAHRAYVAQCERAVRQAEAAIRMLDQELGKWRRHHAEREAPSRGATRNRQR